MSPLAITLLVLALTIIAFVSGKIPFSVVSIFIIITLIMAKVLAPAEALAGFIDTNVVLIISMFVIGAGLTKTSLLDKIQAIVFKYKDKPKMIVLVGCSVSGILAIITSGPATMAIMIPLLAAIAKETGMSRSKILFPASALANICVGMTFLGQGAANLTWSKVMINAGGEIPFTFWDFTTARIPIVIIALLYMVFIGHKLLPNTPNDQFTDSVQLKDTKSKLSPLKEKIAFVIIILTIISIILYSYTKIPMYVSGCVGAALLVIFGILSEKEGIASIHLPTIFLFGGVLALSQALKVTGAGNVIANWIVSVLGNTTNPYIIMSVFFLIPLIMTQVMSNVATIAIFVPLVAASAVKIGVDPRTAVMGVILASCTSILTPMASPTQTLVMAPGGYTIKDYFKCGLPLVIVISIASVIWLPLIFPFYQ